MNEMDLFSPLASLQWVDRETLKPNDYNPNKVCRLLLEVADSINTHERMDTANRSET